MTRIVIYIERDVKKKEKEGRDVKFCFIKLFSFLQLVDVYFIGLFMKCNFYYIDPSQNYCEKHWSRENNKNPLSKDS